MASLLFKLNPVHTKHQSVAAAAATTAEHIEEDEEIDETEEEELVTTPLETVEYEIKKSLSHHLRDRFPLPCTDANSYAPCKCSNLITTINKGGSSIRFSEYKCKDDVNLERIKMRWIPQGYQCRQLLGRKIIYKDDRGKPVNKIQLYYAGCELRCTNRDCKKIIVPKHAEPMPMITEEAAASSSQNGEEGFLPPFSSQASLASLNTQPSEIPLNLLSKLETDLQEEEKEAFFEIPSGIHSNIFSELSSLEIPANLDAEITLDIPNI